MISTVFLLLQISGIAGLCWILSTLVIRRAPSLSAWLCLVGLVGCCTVYILYVVNVPKVSVSSFVTAEMMEASSDFKSNRDNANASVPTTDVRFDWLAVLGALKSKWVSTIGDHPLDFSRWCWNAILAVTGIMVLRVVVSMLLVVRLYRGSECWDDIDLSHCLSTWATDRGVAFRFHLRLSEFLSSPCVTWLHRGTIYLPMEFPNWSREEQLAALAHEATHEMRRDAFWRGFAEILFVTLCFHPMSWLLRHQLVLSQELATDRFASKMMRGKSYQKGLCQLALRMDSQRKTVGVSFGVSFSTSNLVRRIKMLNCKVPSISRCRRGILLLIAMFGSLFLGIWGMNADEPIRVASKQKRLDEITARSFAREISRPWETIGSQPGYFEVQLNDVMTKPKVRSLIDPLLSQYELTFERIGVSFAEEALRLTGNLEFAFQNLEDEEHKNQLSLESTSFELTFRREIDWLPIVRDAIAITYLLPQEMGDTIRNALRNLSKSDKLQLLSKKESEISNPERIQSLWHSIGGGYATVVFTPQGIATIDLTAAESRLEDYEFAWMKVAKATQLIGFGADFANESHHNVYRLALLPDDETSVESLRELVAAAIDSGRLYAESQVKEQGQEISALLDALNQCHVSIQGHQGVGDMVVLGGEFSDSALFPDE